MRNAIEINDEIISESYQIVRKTLISIKYNMLNDIEACFERFFYSISNKRHVTNDKKKEQAKNKQDIVWY